MLRMMSAWEMSSQSSARMVILAAWILETVEALKESQYSSLCKNQLNRY
jgi:hypothetical protein